MTLKGKVAVVTGVTSPLERPSRCAWQQKGLALAVTDIPRQSREGGGALEQARQIHAEALDLTVRRRSRRFSGGSRSARPDGHPGQRTAWRIRATFLETTYADWRNTFAGVWTATSTAVLLRRGRWARKWAESTSAPSCRGIQCSLRRYTRPRGRPLPDPGDGLRSGPHGIRSM